jgi:hypothetical protein
MKTQWKQLKEYFVNVDGFRKKVETPVGVNDLQWQRLFNYWTSGPAIKKMYQMKNTKNFVSNQSHLGCRGYGKLAATMVKRPEQQ